ncbi:MAG: hypothetical protein H7841_06320 [Magnetospirillum sp. WYHS-4]
MGRILPPPQGLDADEIATEEGLLAAIERAVVNLEAARSEGRKISRDEIRLISFLAAEVRRRLDGLTSAQHDEFLHIREQAQFREMESRVRDMASEIDAFVSVADTGHSQFRFSRINELELEIRGLAVSLERDPEKYEPLLGQIGSLVHRLKEVRSRGPLFSGLKDFG